MTREQLQQLVRAAYPEAQSAIVTDWQESDREPGYGVVAYVRDDDHEPFVTHEYRDVEDGLFLLFSGHYEQYAHRWAQDFSERAQRVIR